MDTNQTVDRNMRFAGRKSNWPLALIVIALVALALYALWPQLQRLNNNQAVDSAQDRADNAAREAVSDFRGFITGSGLSNMDGRKADFNNLTVKSTGPNDQVFWVNDQGAVNPSQTQGQDLLVYMNSQVRSQVGTTIKNGMSISVSGTITKAPSVQEMKNQWQLNDNDANYVAGKGVYLNADRVQVTAANSEVKTFTLAARNFIFSPVEMRVKQGDRVKVILQNQEGFHDFTLEEFNAIIPPINAGQTSQVEFTAGRTGTFEYYCSVGDHRQMGMRGNLIVE